MATVDQGDVQISHAPQQGLVKVGVRPPLGVEYTEVIIPVELFFAIVGQSLQQVMSAQLQMREKAGKGLIVPPRLELAKA